MLTVQQIEGNETHHTENKNIYIFTMTLSFVGGPFHAEVTKVTVLGDES